MNKKETKKIHVGSGARVHGGSLRCRGGGGGGGVVDAWIDGWMESLRRKE